ACFFPIRLPPPTSPLSPYTTLFRSLTCGIGSSVRFGFVRERTQLSGTFKLVASSAESTRRVSPLGSIVERELVVAALLGTAASRSEEHTSELQSHLNLVCRLLLEKK